jgi:hypothetical protein
MSKHKWQAWLPSSQEPAIHVHATKAEDAAEEALKEWRKNPKWENHFYHDGLQIAVQRLVDGPGAFGEEPPGLEVFTVENIKRGKKKS